MYTILMPDHERQNQEHIHEVTVFGQSYKVADYGSSKVMEHTVAQRRGFRKPIQKLNDKALAQYVADCQAELENIEAQRLLINQRTDTNQVDFAEDAEASLDVAAQMTTPAHASPMLRSLGRRAFVVAWLKNAATDEQKKRAVDKAKAEAQAELESAVRQLGPAVKALGSYLETASRSGITPESAAVQAHISLSELVTA